MWVTTHPELYWAKAWAAVTGLPLDVMSQATLDDPYTPIPVTSNARRPGAGSGQRVRGCRRDPGEVQLRAVRDQRLLGLGHRCLDHDHGQEEEEVAEVNDQGEHDSSIEVTDGCIRTGSI